jgi:PAS domain S-box-containing protein
MNKDLAPEGSAVLRSGSFQSRVVGFFKSAGGRYLFAFLAVALSGFLILLLRMIFAARSQSYGLIILAALMGASWSGYGPGIFALFLAAFGLPYFLTPNFNPANTDFKNLGLLLIISLLISRISASRDRLESGLRKSNEELDRRVKQRTAELEQANADAHQRLAELENLYVTAAVGLGLVDTNLRFVRVNQLLAAIHGLPVEAHIGRTVREVLPPALADRVAPLYEQVLATGQPILGSEVRAISASEPDVEQDWLVTYSPVKAEDGVVLGIQVVVQDVTQRKRFEDQLRQTQKLESLGILAGGIAHDFNNLLVGILGNTSLALELVPEDSEAQPILKEALAAGERAAALTHQMLAYSGKGRFVVERVDMARLIREILPLIHSAIPRTVELRLDIDRAAPTAEVDVAQVQQLIMNLVINGAEAIPDGQPGAVTVAVSEYDVSTRASQPGAGKPRVAPGRYVCIEVCDNGTGMEEATKARIFDPFFTTKFTGRGLGLAAVSGIVRGHHGHIEVDSFPGQGSVFRILLPAVPGEAAPQPERTEAVFPPAGFGAILVVDDEPMVRQMAQQTLQRRGYDVLVAENGERALDIFRKRGAEIRLVLLDMTMPVMSGEKTLVELRKMRPDTLVVLSSGYNQVDAIQRFAGQGLAGFLQKPYTAAALTTQVAAVLDGKSRGMESADLPH